MMQIYKNQLQQYAQRERLAFPVYTTEVEGPPHLRKFKSTVIVDRKLYGTMEFFSTRKEAEQAAAKVACAALLVDATQETTDENLYKNLLQEFAIKRGFLLPSYETVSSGVDHDRVFASTVEVGQQIFQGAQAKTKKQSQMNAAKIAYCSLTNGCLAPKPSDTSCMDECRVADNLSLSIPLPVSATEPTKKHHDISHEDTFLQAKRLKLSTQSMEVNTLPPNNLPSIDTNVTSSQVENSFHVPTPVPAHPIIERAVENEPMFPANTPPPGNIPPTVPISINSQVENSLSLQLPVDNSSHVSAPADPVNEQTTKNEPVLHLKSPPPSNFTSTVSNVISSQLENSLPTPVNPGIEQTVKNKSVLHVNTPPPRVFPSTVSNVVTSQLESSLPTPVDPVTELTVGKEPLLDVKALSPCKLPSIVPIMSNAQVEGSLSATTFPISEQTIESVPLLQWPSKIVVLPRKSNLPIPEGATVMPFSDERWVAYNIKEVQAPMM